MRSFLYRNIRPLIGNCFAISFINGLFLLGDSLVKNEKEPELTIFGKAILESSPIKSLEFKPALKYLIDNNYKIKIMDPGKLGPWGKYLSNKNVNFKKKRYKPKDLYGLNNNGWVVIPSVNDSKGRPTHSILIYKDYYYDSELENSYNIPISLSKIDNKIPQDNKNPDYERFLLAFKI